MSLLDTALAYHAAGLSTIPTGKNKRPAISEWAAYQDTQPKISQLPKWFSNGSALAVTCGKGSGNLEGLDFDMAGELFEAWLNLVNALVPGLISTLLIEQSPSGGYHVCYRCEQISGNQKLATRWITDATKDLGGEAKTLIETRGQGGYFVVAPSPGYTVIQGDWTNVPTIRIRERTILLDCARALNEYTKPEHTIAARPAPATSPAGDLSPGDDYNLRGDVLALMQRHGWQTPHQRGDKRYLRKPGKQESWQATWNHIPNRLYVFSTSAAPFDHERTYDPFAIYALLECGGDFKAAAKALAAEGFGTRRTPNYQNSQQLSTNSHATAAYTEPPRTRVAPTTYLTDSDPPPPSKLMHADALRNLPPLEWLVPGEIPRNGFAILFGPSGAGKSFVSLDRALTIAQSAPVVYVAAEGLSGYHPRVEAWKERHQASAGHLHFWLDSINMLDPLAVQAFVAEIQALRPQLVVIDTLARCLIGGDENSAKDMGLFVNACDTIRKATGAAVLVVHHSGKGGEYRGSSALLGAADVMLRITSDDEVIKLEVEKIKDGKATDPVAYRLLPTGASCALVPAADVTAVYGGSSITPQQRKILEALALDTFADIGAKYDQIAKITNLAPASIYRSLSSLKQQGFIRQSHKGDPYYLEPRGLAAIGAKNTQNSTDQLSKVKIGNSQQLSPTINQSEANSQVLSATINQPATPTIKLSRLSHPLRGESRNDSSLVAEREADTHADLNPKQPRVTDDMIRQEALTIARSGDIAAAREHASPLKIHIRKQVLSEIDAIAAQSGYRQIDGY